MSVNGEEMSAPPAVEKNPRSESINKAAVANGRFYTGLIDTYLNPSFSGEEKGQKRSGLVENLPTPMKNLYRTGLQYFDDELKANHELLEQHKGQELAFLLPVIGNETGANTEQLQEVIQLLPEYAQDIRYVEPTPGVAVIETNEKFSQLLRDRGILPPGVTDFHIGGDNRDQPSFLFTQGLEPKPEDFQDQGSRTYDNWQYSIKRHEFHHYVWNFLQRRGFIREPNEQTPQASEAFNRFRNELSGYIVGDVQTFLKDDMKELLDADPKALAYTDDETILSKVSDARDFAYVCMELGIKSGAEPATFLYAAMTARNIDELKNNFLLLTPDVPDNMPAILASIYKSQSYLQSHGNIFSNLQRASEGTVNHDNTVLDAFTQVLKAKNIQLQPQDIQQFQLQSLLDPSFKTSLALAETNSNLEHYIQKVQENSEITSVLSNALEMRLGSLPPETRKVIVELETNPDMNYGHGYGFPLDKEPEEFLRLNLFIMD